MPLKLEIITAFSPLEGARERTSVKMHNTESRFLIGLSDILFAGVYVCTFQPGHFTGWE